jgi:hypothetical protein
MKAETAIRTRAEGRSWPASRTVRLGILALLGFLLWSVSGRVAASEPGTPTCKVKGKASTVEYLVGDACPPNQFAETIGYQPVLVETPFGWRYEKPRWAGGECSGPLADRGWYWDFGAACRTHDYGYDLVRFGVGNRPQADDLLYRDMVASCGANAPLGMVACRATARWAHLVLEIGDATGFDPEPIAHE